ncbi:MAG: oligosaccharide flippase family protein [Verrucomicrobiota bacterium]
MAPDSLKQKAVHATLWYGGSRAVIQVINWVVTLATTRLLMPGDYGALGIVMLYAGCVDYLNELGLGAALVQRKDLAAEDLDTVFWFGLSTSAGMYLLTLGVAPFIANFFNQPLLTSLLPVMGLNFLVSGLRVVPWNMLTRQMDFKRRSIAESFGNLCGGLVTYGMARFGFGVWALVAGFMVPNLAITIQVFFQSPWRPRLRFSFPHLKNLFGFSLNVAGSRIAWYLQDNADTFIIGKRLGTQALGYYGIAMRLGAETTGRFLSILNQIAFPLYARLQHDHDKLKEYFLAATEFICAAVFPILVGMFLLADDVIPWLMTAKWAPMILPFKILCLTGIFKTLGSLPGPAVMAKGHAKLQFYFCIAQLLVMPAFYVAGTYYCGVPFAFGASITAPWYYGLIGVCLVWVTIYPLVVAIWLWQTRKIVGYQWGELLRVMAPGTVSTMLMAAVLLIQQHFTPTSLSSPARVAISVGLGIAVYAACLIGGFRKSLIRMIRIIRPKFNQPPATPEAGIA